MLHSMAIDCAVDDAFHGRMKKRPFVQIGKRLSAMREALNLSQAELCRAINVSPNRWNQYEKGERKITIEVAIKLTLKFHVPLDWVYLGDRSMLPVAIDRNLSGAA
jgi:transcriptional regulator with XRE-family HTH domain